MSTRKLLKYSISVATARHSESIVSVTNEAFMADTFFKKAEYFLRFDLATVQKMISDQNSYFLIATTEESEEICGSIFFHLDTKQIENQRMVTCCNTIIIFVLCLNQLSLDCWKVLCSICP